MQYQVMEGTRGMQKSGTASVVKVAREPAIIINGVPDLPPDGTAGSQPQVRDAAESQVDPRFGEWLEGRKVRKLFGEKHYVGKVVKYDSESNWYNVVYEDGDQEDLEWHEVEEILLPLDIAIPLKKLVMDKFKLESTVPDNRSKVGKLKKVYDITQGYTNKTSDLVSMSQGINFTSNQMMVGEANGQPSKNIPVQGLLPASASNDAMSTFSLTGENAQVCLRATNQPRKRGRPRKDRTISGNIQPKKRGRPPKDRSTSGNPSSSLVLVPVLDASVASDMKEVHRRQNCVHKRNVQTAKAEKLKRENMQSQRTPPGSQLLF